MTLGVAVACAMWDIPPLYGDWNTPGGPWNPPRHCSQNTPGIPVSPTWVRQGRTSLELSLERFASGYPCVPRKIPLAGNAPPETVTVNRIAAGWPLRALGGAEIGLLTPTKGRFRVWVWRYHAVFVTPRIISPEAWMIPLRVLPAGFAADTVVFSILAFLAFGAPGAARIAQKRWRGLRGRCASCSYDLRGLSSKSRCPECGVEQQPRNG